MVRGVTGSTAASPLAVLMRSKKQCERCEASEDEAQRLFVVQCSIVAQLGKVWVLHGSLCRSLCVGALFDALCGRIQSVLPVQCASTDARASVK